MKSSFVAAGALGLVLLAACSGGGGATTIADGTSPGAPNSEAGAPGTGAEPGTDGTDAGTDMPSTGPSGCGLANVMKGTTTKTTTVSGKSRRYQVVVPAAYDASRPTRLVFVFHGLGGDGDQIRAYFGFEAQSGGEAIFVYPDGIEKFQGSTAWAESDLVFFDTMVSEISASHCIDRKRIFAAGHSFGGYMSNLVGCERSDVVRAIAPVSGGIVSTTCKGPVAAWLAHGDDDAVVAQSEGIAARDHWLSANTCASTSKATKPSPCVAYDGCSANHPVTWCSFPGGHYPLPGFIKQGIWDFFAGM
jgi:poly(3-hydroxybutyrate) depolymerase